MDRLLNLISNLNKITTKPLSGQTFEVTGNLAEFFSNKELKGKVIKTSGQDAIINFMGKNIPVKTFAPLEPGQYVNVKLKETTGDKIILQLLSEKAEGKFTLFLEQKAENILSVLNMKSSPENMEIIKEAINHELPLEKEFLEKALNIIKNSGGDVSQNMNIVNFIKVNNLPLSKEIFQTLKDFLKDPANIGGKLENLNKELKELLKNESDPKIKNNIEELINSIEKLYLKTTDGKEKNIISLKNLLNELYTPAEKKLLTLIKEEINKPDINNETGNQLIDKNIKEIKGNPILLIKELINNLEKEPGNNKETAKNPLSLFQDFINNIGDEGKGNKNTGKIIKLILESRSFENIKKEYPGEFKEITTLLMKDESNLKPEEKAILQKNLQIILPEIEKNLQNKNDVQIKNLINILQSTGGDSKKEQEIIKSMKSTLNNIDALRILTKNDASEFSHIPFLTLPLPVQKDELLNQGEMRIYKKNSGKKNQNNSDDMRIELLLRTLTMGPVGITIDSKNGQKECEIKVTEQSVKDLFDNSIGEFKEQLKNNNLSVNNISCMVGEVTFDSPVFLPTVEKEVNIRTFDAKA